MRSATKQWQDKAAARAAMDLGTAATVNTGTGNGLIPTRPAAESLSADHVTEITSAHGVDVDGVVCKDGNVISTSSSTSPQDMINLKHGNSAVGGQISLAFYGSDGTTKLGHIQNDYNNVIAGSWLTAVFGYGGVVLQYGSSSTVGLLLDSSGDVVIGTDPGGSELLRVGGGIDSNSNKIRVRTAKTPSSATDTGNAGEVCWDANYIYVCTATNTWKRSAIASW